MFCRVHIADIGAVIDKSLTENSFSNTDIAAAPVMPEPALTPKAVLRPPVVLLRSAAPAYGSVAAAGGVGTQSECSTGRVVRLPLVLRKRAYTPLAVFSIPVPLLYRALPPLAVLLVHLVLKDSALTPMAVLRFPMVLLLSDEKPTAVLYVPLVRLKRAFCPSAVLPPG